MQRPHLKRAFASAAEHNVDESVAGSDATNAGRPIPETKRKLIPIMQPECSFSAVMQWSESGRYAFLLSVRVRPDHSGPGAGHQGNDGEPGVGGGAARAHQGGAGHEPAGQQTDRQRQGSDAHRHGPSDGAQSGERRQKHGHRFAGMHSHSVERSQCEVYKPKDISVPF